MVDKNCPMDIASTTASNSKIDTLQKPVIDILNRLQQAGLFRALVLDTKGNSVLLDTAFGQLKGVTADKLNKGDEIFARLLSTKSEQTIKVEQIVSSRQALPTKIVNQLIKFIDSAHTNANNKQGSISIEGSNQLSSLPRVIKVLEHTAKQTLLRINQKTYSIPHQALLEKGETLLLQTNSNNKVELLRINPESILKSALSQLLPRLTKQKNTIEFSHLQKLMVSILKLNPAVNPQLKTLSNNPDKNLQTRSIKTEQNQQQNLLAISKTTDEAALKSTMKAVLASQMAAPQTEIPVKLISQLINNLSQPLARTDNLNAESIQKIFTMLSLIKPAASSSNMDRLLSSIPAKLHELHQAVKTSPENFKVLLSQILETNSSGNKVKVPDHALLELSSTLKTELLQQLEQTINQFNAQKTTIRLNQELNQPVQVNINIPLQMNDDSKSLALKIKEHNTNANSEEKHWEINLSFEFAQLGLISTSILLQDTRLSAHFWAEKPDTKQLIDTHMDQFKNQLKKSGFELGLFDCFIGKPAAQDENSHPVGENLVDIKV